MKTIEVTGTFYNAIPFFIDFAVDNLEEIVGSEMTEIIYKELLKQDKVFLEIKENRDNHIYRCTQIDEITDGETDLYILDENDQLVEDSTAYSDESTEVH